MGRLTHPFYGLQLLGCYLPYLGGGLSAGNAQVVMSEPGEFQQSLFQENVLLEGGYLEILGYLAGQIVVQVVMSPAQLLLCEPLVPVTPEGVVLDYEDIVGVGCV